ncbi:MAG: ABC-type transport auxiliary lipoprotein family protein [Planctomycetota bacterium]
MRALVLVALAQLCGCALVSKAEPLEVRYLAPPLSAPAASAAAPGGGAPSAARPLLRLRRVAAAEHLRQRLVVAISRNVYRQDDARSWTEEPAGYLETALGRALYEGGPFRRALGEGAPELEVELQAFELAGEPVGEDEPPRLRARVEVRLLLGDGRVALREETLAAERKLADEAAGDAIAAAMGEALAEVVQGVVQRTQAAVVAAPPGAR